MMNNSKTVSEKEIIQVIEMLNESVNEFKKKCHRLVYLTQTLNDDTISIKQQLNTLSSVTMIDDMGKKILNLVEKEKNIFRMSESVVVDINYTSIQDVIVRDLYGE